MYVIDFAQQTTIWFLSYIAATINILPKVYVDFFISLPT